MVANNFKSIVVCGHANGSLNVYDFSAKQQLNKLSFSHSISALCLLNNNLHIAVGLASGSIHLLETKGSYSTVGIVQKAHLQKYDEAVNSIVELNSDASNSDANAGQKALPYFVSCGADSLVKIFEHNLYSSKPKAVDDKSDSAAPSNKVSLIRDEFQSGVTDEKDTAKKAEALRAGFEKSGNIQDVFGQLFASQVIGKLVEVNGQEAVYDLDKLATDGDYLSATALKIFDEVLKK